ncbi:unnamed protein product, partial [Chrysoparadoxa australica]
QVICSCLAHLKFPHSRVVALRLLLHLARYCTDAARLQRLVPSVVSLLDDAVPVVRTSAVRTLRELMEMVTAFPPSEANIFGLYLFPALHRLATDPEDIVRLALTECLASFAEDGKRFLDLALARKLAQFAKGTVNGGTVAGKDPATDTDSLEETSAGMALMYGSHGVLLLGGSSKAHTTNLIIWPSSQCRHDGRAAITQTDRHSSLTLSLLRQVQQAAAAAAAAAAPAPAQLVDGPYDSDLVKLRRHIGRWFILLASFEGSGSSSVTSVGSPFHALGASASHSCGTSMVKLALLADIGRFCSFFGQEGTLNSILPQLITFLNDRDWQVRAAFCKHIPAVCAFVGSVATAKVRL